MVPARKQLLDGNVQLLRRVLKFADDDDQASEGFRFTAPVTHHVALRAAPDCCGMVWMTNDDGREAPPHR